MGIAHIKCKNRNNSRSIQFDGMSAKQVEVIISRAMVGPSPNLVLVGLEDGRAVIPKDDIEKIHYED